MGDGRKELQQCRACALVGIDPGAFRDQANRPDDDAL